MASLSLLEVPEVYSHSENGKIEKKDKLVEISNYNELVQLAKIICYKESSPLKKPEAAYNRNKKKRKDGSVYYLPPDLGPCQINTETLVYLGYLSDGWKKDAVNDPKQIFDKDGSLLIAITFLSLIDAKLKEKHIQLAVYNYAYKYRCGLKSEIYKNGYCSESANKIVDEYIKLYSIAKR